MRIRKANPTDAELLAQLISRAFRDVAEKFALTSENCPSHPSNYTPDRVSSDFRKGNRYFILEDEDMPCGCVAMEAASSEHCYLERLAVLPEYRSRGFGEALLGHIVEEAKALGMNRIEIAIIGEHTSLQKWYEDRGFETTHDKNIEHLPFTVRFMRRLIL